MPIRSSNITRNLEARKSSRPVIGRGTPINSKGDDGDLTFRRTSGGLKLYIKASGKWHGVKVGESFDSLEKKIDELKLKDRLSKQFRLPSTYSISEDFTIDSSGNISLDADGGEIYLKDGGTTFGNFSTSSAYSSMTLYEDGGITSNDFFQIYTGANGQTTVRTVDGAGTAAHLTLDPDGDLIVSGADVKIDAAKKLYLDGGGDTYIYENSADSVKLFVGGDEIFRILEQGTDGNQLYFIGASVGFNQLEPTYDATATNVDFRLSNKQNLTFGSGSITNVNLYFPNMSGKFVLLVKQDGTGSRTITNWKVYESDESSADGSNAVKWAGGSAPTLTTDANHVDIISFYWDADTEIAYGVATLDFQF